MIGDLPARGRAAVYGAMEGDGGPHFQPGVWSGSTMTYRALRVALPVTLLIAPISTSPAIFRSAVRGEQRVIFRVQVVHFTPP
ncbi:MAG: hypothetical protein DSZ00_08570 [Gammaproteobacteria bacterium]|nr:MAG: hypothetical protein DSZ00_08570 [Gammaproteobacteria bacterium]